MRLVRGVALVIAGSVVLSSCSLKQDGAGGATVTVTAPAPGGAAAVTASAPAEDIPSLAGKRVGISIVGTDHYWDRNAYESAQAEVTRLGGTPIAVQAGRTGTQQIADLENLVSQKPDAMISILGDAAALAPEFQKIRDAGIPLFTMDQPSPLSINNVTSDNYRVGSTVMRTMAEDMGGKGNILLFNGFTSTRVCNLRYEQFQAVLKDYPGIKILQPELQDVIPGTVEDARQKTADALNRYPKGEIQAVAASCWDIPGIGAEQAIKAAGRTEIKVYGNDGDPAALALVCDPNSPYQADVAQQPKEIGKTSAQNVAKYLAGNQVTPTTYFDPILITKDNCAETMPLLGIDGS